MEGKKLHKIMDEFMDREREHQKEIQQYDSLYSRSKEKNSSSKMAIVTTVASLVTGQGTVPIQSNR